MRTPLSNPAWELAFGKRLQQARLNAGITQKQAAKATGVAVGTWVGWELGTRTPKLWNVPKAAAALGVPVASLLVENDHAACVTEVWLSAQTIRDVRTGGRAAALGAGLVALIERTDPPLDVLTAGLAIEALVTFLARPVIDVSEGRRYSLWMGTS